jgi:hypothetical protein
MASVSQEWLVGSPGKEIAVQNFPVPPGLMKARALDMADMPLELEPPLATELDQLAEHVRPPAIEQSPRGNLVLIGQSLSSTSFVPVLPVS